MRCWILVATLVTLMAAPLAAQQASEAKGPVGAVSQGTSARVAPDNGQPGELDRTRETLFGKIHGTALQANSDVLAYQPVRLRDARLGDIVDKQMTDQAGEFAFRPVNPGSYVVEIVDIHQSVLAASQLLDVAGGQIIATIVQLSSKKPGGGVILGRSAASTAAAIVAAAASSGILAKSATGSPVTPR